MIDMIFRRKISFFADTVLHVSKLLGKWQKMSSVAFYKGF